MRQRDKKQILEILEVIDEAVKYIEKNENVEYLWDDCAEGTHSCFNFVVLIGENSLKEMFEKLYECIFNKNIDDAKIIINKTKNKINKIESTYEIVFLPYKADMWDTFESVWEAAKEQKNCNVKVIPIPYFTANENGQFNTIVYDGDRFPSNVDVTLFSEYDLNAQRPDVIFIFNPYDGSNFVTRVHPEYFSTNLVKYTDKLVYIPYFVINGKTPEHLIKQEGVRNAWRVFVASEEDREAYIETKFVEPDKIVSMGSPKIDAVMKCKENYYISEEWKNIIGERKVIFFNTSIGQMLENMDLTMTHIKNIIETLASNNDLVVIWRPHPLIISTIRSMRPQYLNQYQKIVEEFRTLKNGIYDDSPDFHMAFAASDAYLGQGSSLLPLYSLTNKPIFYLNSNTDILDRQCPYYYYSTTVYEGKLYFIPIGKNEILKLDYCTGVISKVVDIPEKDETGVLYSFLNFVKDEILLVPSASGHILVYNITHKIFKKIELPDGFKYGKFSKFLNGVTYNDSIWLIPRNSNVILKYDYNTNNVESYYEWPEQFRKKEKQLLFGGWHRTNNILWLAPLNSPFAIKLDLITGNMTEYKLTENENDSFGAVTSDGQYIWFAPWGGQCVVKLNGETGETETYSQWPDGIIFGKRNFIDAKYLDGKIYFIPVDVNMIIKMDISTGKMYKISDDIFDEKVFEGKARYSLGTVINDNIVLSQTSTKELAIINTKKDTMYKVTQSIDDILAYENLKKYDIERQLAINGQYFIKDSEEVNLVCRAFCESEFTVDNLSAFDNYKSCGKLIWKYIWQALKKPLN